MRALGLGLPLGLSLNLPALGLPGLQNLPAANVLAPVISAVDGLLQCGVQGPASSSCPTRMVGYENDIPMSLIGCYRACEVSLLCFSCILFVMWEKVWIGMVRC